MKKYLFFITVAILLSIAVNAQNRVVARGAEFGELYMSGPWYAIYAPPGPPFYDTLRMAVYHLIEHGKKISIQYDADYFSDYFNPPGSVMIPDYILADATSGVVYNKQIYYKNDGYLYTALWISFDYGKQWILRDENIESKGYFATNVKGLIYRTGYDGIFESKDYGNIFYEFEGGLGMESGIQYGEGFRMWCSNPYQGRIFHSCDFFETYTEFPIDSQFMCGQVSGYFPDVYRGGKEGEVYISSRFPDGSYKVSFSADTGQTFRHVCVRENYSFFDYIGFMSDREPGVFYILRRYEVEDTNPWGWHLELCVEYYRDYGEILEAIFCHDLVRGYEYVENPCEHITDLVMEVVNENSIQLQWSNVADNIRGYHVFKNNMRITSEMLTGTTYLDENLPDGAYEYFVRAYYQEGCPSDSSNHVTKTIGEEETCEPVNDLAAEIIDNNSILLTWTEPESDLTVEGYNIFRNNALLTEEPATVNSHLDENLPNGDYEYYVITHYTNGCISDNSNHVKETVGVGIVETHCNASLRVYPNPTDGILNLIQDQVECKDAINRVSTMTIANIEIFDVFGRKAPLNPPEGGRLPSFGGVGGGFDISHLPSGIYFMRITTENGVVTRKVVKR